MSFSYEVVKKNARCRRSVVSVFLILVLFVGLGDIYSQTTFTRITTGDITSGIGGRWGSWGDYDNDGHLDLLVVVYSGSNNLLYHNNGDGTFTAITEGAIVAEPSGRSTSGNWGDFDNDGHLDLFVTTDLGDYYLYQNNGDGTFDPVTSGLFLNNLDATFNSCLGDYDSDGYLDLYLANARDPEGNNYLFHNEGGAEGAGNVSFSRITQSAAVIHGGYSWACSWIDYDNDGDLDLFVINQTIGEIPENFLYQNNGDGSFTRIGGDVLANNGNTPANISWGDYDNDGDLDLFIALLGSSCLLYNNNGDGSFTPIATGLLASDEVAYGSWGDYDNDGDLDLLAAYLAAYDEATFERDYDMCIYQNEGTSGETGQVSFTRMGLEEIFGGIDAGPDAWGDYDNDGDLDIFTIGDGDPISGQHNALYRNNGNGYNWINIKCVGTVSNRSAIGTKVRVKAEIAGTPVWQLREISGQNGNSLNAQFGLGQAAMIDSVKIEWPSGQNLVLVDVAVNQVLTVTEFLPPQIQLASLGIAEANSEISVQAGILSDLEAAEANLSYRRGGNPTFTTVPMANQGSGSFQATIPASEVTASGVEYYITAEDILGNPGRLPSSSYRSIQVRVSDGLSKVQEEPHGIAQTAYHIFSVPLDLEDKRPAAIFEDDMGEYDDTRWRFLEVTGDNTTREFPDITAILPGKGYWFLVTEPARFIDTGPGTSNPTAEVYAIALRPGWNLVGNPFNFSVPVDNLSLQSDNESNLRTFTGSWNNPVTAPVQAILPFEGYAVFNAATFTDTLLINPDRSLSEATLAKSAQNEQIFWSIGIRAQCQKARDVDNVLGIAQQASESWDPLDYPEPPPIGEYVSVYFDRSEWSNRSQRFCTDFRPAFSQGGEWEFEVRTNIRDRVELTFAGIETVPQEFDVWLLDESLSLTQNLRSNPSFSVAGVGEDHPKRLKLLVGRRAFVDELLPQQKIPTDFKLSQNFPNPFNPVTSIRYGLPREARVTLKIFNILGEEVATLLNDESQLAGHHVVIWDGRDQQGGQVASGVYLYRIVVGDLRETRKMALVR